MEEKKARKRDSLEGKLILERGRRGGGGRWTIEAATKGKGSVSEKSPSKGRTPWLGKSVKSKKESYTKGGG